MRLNRSGALGPALLLALALLFLLGMLATYQLTLSSQSVHVAAWDAGGAVAEEVATSAIEEAAWKLNCIFTDPNLREYDELHLAILLPKDPAMDITNHVYPTQLKKLLARAADRPLYRALSLEVFRVVLGLPQGGQQVVDFDAVVTLGVTGHTIYRRVVERRRYGVTFISPLKPWDRVTVAILDHSGVPPTKKAVADLLRSIHDTNEVQPQVNFFVPPPGSCDPAPDRILPGGLLLDSFIRFGKAPSLPPDLTEKLEKLKASTPDLEKKLEEMEENDRSWELWRLVGSPRGKKIPIPGVRCFTQPQLPPLSDIPKEQVFQKFSGSTSTVTSVLPSVDLKPFDYEVRLRDEYKPAKERLERRIEEGNKLLAEAMRHPPTSEGERASLFGQLHRILSDLPALYREAASRLNPISRHLAAHTRLSPPPTGGGPKLKPVAYHLNTQADFDQFRSNYPAFSGHVGFCGRTDLVAAMSGFSGKMILSQQYLKEGEPERNLVLDGVSAKDRQQDLLIVHADRLSLRNPDVEAGVYVHDRLFLEGGQANIKGQLVMEALRPLKERTRTEELAGTVAYRPELASGAFPHGDRPVLRPPSTTSSEKEAADGLALDHWPMALLPRGRDRAVYRSPGAFAAAGGR
jgi:hypothetical protein